MKTYLGLLGVVLIVSGFAASLYLAVLWNADEAYYQAAKALAKYPNNVLYQSELKMAEPRHMLLAFGAVGAGPCGLVFGSLCLGIATVLERLSRRPDPANAPR
jgi:hypothetical protein